MIGLGVIGMAEEIKHQIDLLETTKLALENAVPLLITEGKTGEGLGYVIQAAEKIQELSFDPAFSELSTNMKILANSGSSILQTVSFQAFILDLLEMISPLLETLQNTGPPQGTDANKYLHISEYLIRLSGRVVNRYKLQINFEPEYEAKSLRAFMCVKELAGVVKFLNIAPDISENQQANLDNGLEVDCISQESADSLHKLAGSVLEVQSVQVFIETKAQPVRMLDPPSDPSSFDAKISEFLNQ